MIEIIAVLLLMAIVSAVVINRYMVSDTDLITRTEVIKAHIRYAQSRALNTNVIWGIRLAETQYGLFKNDGTVSMVKLPGEDSTAITMPAGTSVTTGIISFDDWGKPYTDATATNAQSGDLTITITGSSGTRTFVITQNTGFIP